MLGGMDLNPDDVVQRAVNVFRSALVGSLLLRFSPPALRFALVRSGLFWCEMSHCVSGRALSPATKNGSISLYSRIFTAGAAGPLPCASARNACSD